MKAGLKADPDEEQVPGPDSHLFRQNG